MIFKQQLPKVGLARGVLKVKLSFVGASVRIRSALTFIGMIFSSNVGYLFYYLLLQQRSEPWNVSNKVSLPLGPFK